MRTTMMRMKPANLGRLMEHHFSLSLLRGLSFDWVLSCSPDPAIAWHSYAAVMCSPASWRSVEKMPCAGFADTVGWPKRHTSLHWLRPATVNRLWHAVFQWRLEIVADFRPQDPTAALGRRDFSSRGPRNASSCFAYPNRDRRNLSSRTAPTEAKPSPLFPANDPDASILISKTTSRWIPRATRPNRRTDHFPDKISRGSWNSWVSCISLRHLFLTVCRCRWMVWSLEYFHWQHLHRLRSRRFVPSHSIWSIRIEYIANRTEYSYISLWVTRARDTTHLVRPANRIYRRWSVRGDDGAFESHPSRYFRPDVREHIAPKCRECCHWNL